MNTEKMMQSAREHGMDLEGSLVAYEFYNQRTGHAIVDYTRWTHAGHLTEADGYEARPLVYDDSRVLLALVEALVKAGRFIAWSNHGECRAYSADRIPTSSETREAIDAALAIARGAMGRQSPNEPVAWRTFDGEGGWEYRGYEGNETYRDEYIARNGEKYASWVEPLFSRIPDQSAKP